MYIFNHHLKSIKTSRFGHLHFVHESTDLCPTVKTALTFRNQPVINAHFTRFSLTIPSLAAKKAKICLIKNFSFSCSPTKKYTSKNTTFSSNRIPSLNPNIANQKIDQPRRLSKTKLKNNNKYTRDKRPNEHHTHCLFVHAPYFWVLYR